MADTQKNEVLDELPSTVTLNLQQGLLLHSLIEVMTRRGALMADELKPIGELFDFVKKELKVEQHIKRLQEMQKKQNEKSDLPAVAE